MIPDDLSAAPPLSQVLAPQPAPSLSAAYGSPSPSPAPAPAPTAASAKVGPADLADLNALRQSYAASLAPSPSALAAPPASTSPAAPREAKAIRKDDRKIDDLQKRAFLDQLRGGLENATVAPSSPFVRRFDAPTPVSTSPPAKINPAALAFATPAGPREDQSFALPQGPGTKVVPAHSVAVVDPALQAQEGALAQRMQATNAQIGETKVAEGLANARGQEGIADADRAKAAALEKSQSDQRAQLAPLIADMQKASRERSALQMRDPDQRGVPHRIADAIGAGLAAAGQGLLHQGGPNPVLDRIHGDIDREVARQKEEFQRKGAAIDDQHNLFARVYQLTGDEKLATQAAQGALVDAAKDHANASAIASGAPGARLAAKQLNERIDESRIGQQIQQNQYTPATSAGPSQAQILARRQALADKFGLTPAEANRREVLERTGKDVAPGTELGPLSLVGRSGAGGASLDPKSIPSLEGASTNWDLSRKLQGTEAHANLERQKAYNSEVLAFGKTNLGVRIPGTAQAYDVPALEAYAIKPDDSQKTIAEKRAAFLEAIRRHPKPAGKGSAEPEGEGEGAP